MGDVCRPVTGRSDAGHRDELSKGLVLHHRQLAMRQLVLDVQTMESAVFGQTAIAQQRTGQYRSLILREHCRSMQNFPRRYPHSSNRTAGFGWTGWAFTDIASFVNGVTAREDKIPRLLLSPE